MNKLKSILVLTIISIILDSSVTQAQTVHYGKIKGLAFTKDDKILATLDDAGRIKLWQMPALAPLYSGDHFWVIADGSFDEFTFNNEGTWILGGNRQVVLFNVKDKKEIDIPLSTENVHFSSDGKSVVAIVEDGNSVTVKKIALDNPKIIPEKGELNFKIDIKDYAALQIVEFLPDHYAYLTTKEPIVYFHKKGEKKPYAQININLMPEYVVASFKLSSDKKYLIPGGQDEVYEISSGTPQKKYSLKGSEFASKKREYIISGEKLFSYDENSISTFDLSTGKLENQEKFKAYSSFWVSTVSHDGKYLVLVDKEPHNLQLFISGRQECFVLNESPFAAVKNYALLGNKDSTLSLLRKCLKSENKPNLNLVSQDSLFFFLKESPGWKEIMNGSWYSPYEKAVLDGEKKFMEGKYEDAYQLLTQAIALEPKKEKAYEVRAAVGVQMAKTTEAEKDCDACLTANSKNLTCLTIRSDLKVKAGKKAEAAKDYQSILYLDHTKTDLHLEIAKLLLYNNDKEAKEHVEKYLVKVNYNAEAYALKALLAERAGEKEHAGRYYKQAINISPREEYYAKALDCMLSGDNLNSAHGLVNDWLKQSPGNSKALSYRTKIEAKEGKGKVSDPTACSACAGTGLSSYEANCVACNGKGRKLCTRCGGRRFVYNSQGQSSYCDGCRGEGYSICYKCYGHKNQQNSMPCRVCGGKGKK